MDELKLGDVVKVIWPDDPYRKPRTSVIVGIKTDDDGSLYRLVWGSGRGVGEGLSNLRPWHLLLDADESKALGLDGCTRLDISKQKSFASILRRTGNIKNVPGLKEAILDAHEAYKRHRQRHSF